MRLIAQERIQQCTVEQRVVVLVLQVVKEMRITREYHRLERWLSVHDLQVGFFNLTCNQFNLSVVRTKIRMLMI